MQTEIDFSPAVLAPVAVPARRLVILGCSATKTDAPGYVPAIERYNGPLWQTLRTVDPDGKRAARAFLSAEYGFGDADLTSIKDYNTRMTPERARHMIAGGLDTRWPRPPNRKSADSWGMHAACTVDGMSRHRKAPFDDVALVGGELYLEVMRAFLALFVEAGHVKADARVTEINAPIGYMRQQLRAWLEGGVSC